VTNPVLLDGYAAKHCPVRVSELHELWCAILGLN
jgi:hypothetical protein